MVLPLMNKWYQSPSCRSPARVPSRRRATATAGAVLVRGRCPTHSRCAAPSARCALSNVAMGQSSKMVGSLRSLRRSARACLLHRAPSQSISLYQATPGTSFQVGHSNNPNAQNRQWHIEKELVRLRPTTLSRKNQPVLHVFDLSAPLRLDLLYRNQTRDKVFSHIYSYIRQHLCSRDNGSTNVRHRQTNNQ